MAATLVNSSKYSMKDARVVCSLTKALGPFSWVLLSSEHSENPSGL